MSNSLEPLFYPITFSGMRELCAVLQGGLGLRDWGNVVVHTLVSFEMLKKELCWMQKEQQLDESIES